MKTSNKNFKSFIEEVVLIRIRQDMIIASTVVYSFAVKPEELQPSGVIPPRPLKATGRYYCVYFDSAFD